MHAEHLAEGGEPTALAACLAAFSKAPHKAALLCDIDGTISPIAPHPADAIVPESFVSLLEALTKHLGLVAFLTGRSLEDGRRMIPLEGAVYVGTHGLETMGRDGVLHTDPGAEPYIEQIKEVAEEAAQALDCEALGVVLEEKRTALAVHYRLAPNKEATREEIVERVVKPARARGLAISTGHFAFEIKPPLQTSKGTAALSLLGEHGSNAALFCGDDLTDITGFLAVRRWAAVDPDRTGCALAAITGETPQEVIDEADVLVHATPGVHEALSLVLAAVRA